MSDSDDDAAFASADEGDEESVKNQPKPKSACKAAETTTKAGTKDDAASGESTAKQPAKTKGGDKGKKQKGKKKKNKQTNQGSEATTSQEVDSNAGKEDSVSQSTETIDSKAEGDSMSAKSGSQTSTSHEEKVIENVCEQSVNDVETKCEEKSSDRTESSLIQSSDKLPGERNSGEDGTDDKVSGDHNESRRSLSKTAESSENKDVEESAKSALDRLTESQDQAGGWSWGSWGSKFVDVASSSVSTFSNQLGEGFTTIMDTVEETLGAPSAEELVKLNQVKEAPEGEEDIPRGEESSAGNNTPDKDTESVTGTDSVPSQSGASKGGGGSGGWFSGWGVSSLTSVVQNTTSMSKNLVSGSLDVLETIGKKTFDVIKEHDPMLRKTKEMFLFDKGDKPNLSHVLREAKKEAAAKVEMEHQIEEARKVNFGAVFDEFQGLAHLEALEILSNQCEKKIQSLLTSMSEERLASIKSNLIEIKKVFEKDEDDEEELDQDQDFEKLVTEQISQLKLGTTPDKLTKCQKNIQEKLHEFEAGEKERDSVTSLHQLSIQSLAELTSKSVEHFHKAGELILLNKESNISHLEKAKNLESLTKVLCCEVEITSSKFCQCLNKLAENLEDSKEVNPVLTNIYLEASNSSTYIQDAFLLLLPCLQQAAIEAMASNFT